jgi:glycosyltransferase involved in cell wall biosynthesis
VKILHLISSGGMYGAEAVILTLMRELRTGPHRSALGVFQNESQPQAQLYERAIGEGLETYSLGCRGQVDFSLVRAIRELVERCGADVVHAHGYKADVYVYLALRGAKAAMVSTCHTWYDNDLALRVYGVVDRWVLRRFAGVAAVSDEVRQRLLKAGVRESRVVLVRNGIELGPFVQRVAREALCVGLVGRLDREKGVDVFLRAAAVVLQQLPRTRFVVAGDGPERASLEALLGELGLGERVRLVGREEDMAGFYASIDLLVSSSRQEGLPMALLEGMGSGLALVATRVGEVPTVVEQGRTGVLVAPEDVEALAGAMVGLLGDAELRARYGAAGRERIASEFSARRMTDAYVRLYERVCAAG